MKLLKLVLLIVLLGSVGILAGCEAGYVRRPERKLHKVYRQRPDAVHIKSNSYRP